MSQEILQDWRYAQANECHEREVVGSSGHYNVIDRAAIVSSQICGCPYIDLLIKDCDGASDPDNDQRLGSKDRKDKRPQY